MKKVIKFDTKKLTWDDLADEYDKVHSGRKARTLTMDSVFAWAQTQTDKFKVSEGFIYRVIKR